VAGKSAATKSKQPLDIREAAACGVFFIQLDDVIPSKASTPTVTIARGECMPQLHLPAPPLPPDLFLPSNLPDCMPQWCSTCVARRPCGVPLSRVAARTTANNEPVRSLCCLAVLGISVGRTAGAERCHRSTASAVCFTPVLAHLFVP